MAEAEQILESVDPNGLVRVIRTDAAQTETAIAQMADTDPVGPLTLRGFAQPVAAFRLKAIRD